MTETDFAVLGNLQDLDLEHIPFLDHIGDLAHAAIGQLADMNQPIGAGHDLNKRSEICGFLPPFPRK